MGDEQNFYYEDISDIEEYQKYQRSQLLAGIKYFKEHEKIRESNSFPNFDNDEKYEYIKLNVGNDNNENNDDENENQRTCFITRSKKTTEIKIKKEFFKFKKVAKNKLKKGRRNSKNPPKFQAKHNKNSSDNLRKKIKRQFIKSTMNYINKLYKKYSLKNSQKFLLKIIPDFCAAPIKEDNQKYFPMTLRQLFSSDLGRKFSIKNKDNNKNNIKALYQQNKAKEIIELLDKTIEEAFEIYISNDISGFSLKHDLKNIEKNEGSEYANNFEIKAKNLLIGKPKRNNEKYISKNCY